MFSEQYKKDMNNLTLDVEYINHLKLKLREEKTRLEEVGTAEPNPNSREIKQFKNKRLLRKDILPIALTACAALAAIAVIPNLRDGSIKKDASTNMTTSDTAAEEPVEYSTSAESSASQSSSNDKKDSYGAFSAEDTMEEAKESDSNTSIIADEAKAEDSSENTEAGVPSEKSFIISSTNNGQINLSFNEATIDFNVVNDFIPTEQIFLNDLITQYKSYPHGADFVQLDYAYHDRIILHDYYDMLVYDMKEQKILRVVSLKDRIGDYTTQGDTALVVTVYEGGNYVLLHRANTNDTDESYYLYDIQIDCMITLTSAELATLSPPPVDDHLSYDSSTFDSLFDKGARSLAVSNISENQQCVLFYDAPFADTIASLSVCIATLSTDSTIVETKNYMIFE